MYIPLLCYIETVGLQGKGVLNCDQILQNVEQEGLVTNTDPQKGTHDVEKYQDGYLLL